MFQNQGGNTYHVVQELHNTWTGEKRREIVFTSPLLSEVAQELEKLEKELNCLENIYTGSPLTIKYVIDVVVAPAVRHITIEGVIK